MENKRLGMGKGAAIDVAAMSSLDGQRNWDGRTDGRTDGRGMSDPSGYCTYT